MQPIFPSNQENAPVWAPLRSVFSAVWRFMLVFFLLIGLVTVPSGAVTAESTSANLANPIYFPWVTDTRTRLISPENGAVLDTLVPLFQWNDYISDEIFLGCLGLGTAPHPNCMVFYGSFNELYRFRFWENLSPGTKYYWRVATFVNEDFNNPVWTSAEWSFTTAPAGGQVPAAPSLISPANNAAIPQSSLLFTWNPSAGAIEYALYFASPTEYRTSIWFTSETNLDMSTDYGLKANLLYRWYVKARNDYAWGPPSPARDLTLTSVNTSSPLGTRERTPQATWEFDGQNVTILQGK